MNQIGKVIKKTLLLASINLILLWSFFDTKMLQE